MSVIEPPARLFTALWPDARTRDAIAAAAARWTWNAGAAHVRAERLHLTLHFLGAVARERVPGLRAALALPFEPFALTLVRPALWAGGVAVLEPARVPPALAQLQAALVAALRRLALPVEARAFRPHVTLARRAAGAAPPVRRALVGWPVNSYALVESHGPAGYTLLQRYPAAGALALERGQRSGSAAGFE